MISVTGKVVSRTRPGVSGLRVEIVDKNVGPDTRVAETATDDHGAYRASFEVRDLDRSGKQRPDLQARVFAGNRFLGASEVRYDATDRETLNVVLAPSADAELPSEHETLTSAVAARFGGNLGDLQEDDDRQDITYLANKTGWDARAVAMAALADQFSSRSVDASGRPAIAPPFFYALFRAGLPAHETSLFRTDLSTVRVIWAAAIEQGVIPASLKHRIKVSLEAFEQAHAKRVLDAPPVAGLSTLKEMLAVSLGVDQPPHEQFAAIYAKHSGKPAEMWAAVREEFGEDIEQRLRVDGQLASMTVNNAPLIRKLHAAAGARGITHLRQLPALGFYRASVWLPVLGLDETPPEIPGESPEQKRDRYAEFLAAQTRLSFPTGVVAEMIRRGETPIADGVRTEVHSFLKEHENSFELGAQPIERYVARNAATLSKVAVQEIKRVQRVYQITPSDDAMNTLLRKGVDSALVIARLEREQFVRTYKDDLEGEEKARLVHARAQQIHNVALNIALNYVIARTAPPIGVHSPAQITDPGPKISAANAGDVIAYATLETLFDEMDYCDCEHCRSILSPAAYLVELLGFCDRTPAAGGKTPQEILFERRPDIQYLPLTCENTNIAVPYIDLVNETLEYFVANGWIRLVENGNVVEEYKGHSTDGSMSSAEILASPENADSLVSLQVYGDEDNEGILKHTGFPPPLPFHRSLEMVRLHLKKFEVGLSELMEALRRNDDVAPATEYGWREILIEEIGLSLAEYSLLTGDDGDGSGPTLQQIYGFPANTAENDVLFGTWGDQPDDRFGIAYPKAFSRRLGITYEDVAELLRTQFVNPNAALISKLLRLGVPFTTLKQLKDNPPGTAFDDEFDALMSAAQVDQSKYDGDVKDWVRDPGNYERIMGLIVLTNKVDPTDTCTFEKLQFAYSDPDAANEIRAFEFVRMLRMVRLWKKLGWTLAQTDKAILALYPADQAPNSADDAVNDQRLNAGFAMLLPRLGVVKRVIDALKLKASKDLLPLLACFGPIGSHGEDSLYRGLFVSAAAATQDSAFADDGYGQFLQDVEEKLADHSATLRGAFQLTEDELTQILEALAFSDETPLTLENVSAVFRRGWLAKKLKISVRELLLLSRFTGIDPFAPPDPPNPSILRFIQLVQRLRATGLRVDQVLYLLWNEDLSGKAAPDADAVLSFARSLRSAFSAIDSEFALVDDPDGQVARARMALVYGLATTDAFFGLLANALSVEVEYAHPTPSLEEAILAIAPGRLTYDNFRKKLTFAGDLTQELQGDFLAVAEDKLESGIAGAFQAAINQLFIASKKVTDTFFERYPTLRDPYDAFVDSDEPIEKKRLAILDRILPELKQRRKRLQAVQTTAVTLGVDAVFASSILENSSVLRAANATAPAQAAAVDDLIAMERPGLTVTVYFGDQADGDPDITLPDGGHLAYSVESTEEDDHLPPNEDAPGEPISAVFEGYLDAPVDGFYNVRIEVDAGASLVLSLAGANVTLAANGNGTVWTNNNPISLRAGVLHRFELRAEKIKSALRVTWQTFGTGFEPISLQYLYSDVLVIHLREVYVRVLKTASLTSILKVTAREFVRLAEDEDSRIDVNTPDDGVQALGWVNSLTTLGSPSTATAIALRDVLGRLIDYARIKAAFAPLDERLVAVLEQLDAGASDATDALVALTRWDGGSLSDLLARFLPNPSAGELTHIDNLARVFDAFSLLKNLKVPASVALEIATSDPSPTTVRSLRSALRARYDEAAWFDVLRPINDQTRAMQRDALVAHVLHQFGLTEESRHIDSVDKLFEFFLMDVGMEPCMQTSRVRHALSSVQLFIERCLMNLERRVAPSTLSSPRWEWMKRYRVWEANRKLFLYPENWLEPELRDDQSPFYKELMSELLQKDITDDAAQSALLTYLSKLEEVAKLEPCGIYYVEADGSHANSTAHVVARTVGANRKYFYRRREGISWTPWEGIPIDIEDVPAIPVVWKERLFVFWLKIIKDSPPLPSPPVERAEDANPGKFFADNPIRVPVKGILCWSELFNGKWQPTRTSDVAQAFTLDELGVSDPFVFDRSSERVKVLTDGDDLLIQPFENRGVSLRVRNTNSQPHEEGDVGWNIECEREYRTVATCPILPDFDPLGDPEPTEPVVCPEGLIAHYRGAASFERQILEAKPVIGPGSVIESRNKLSAQWTTPFFYFDGRHAFYVTTERGVPARRDDGFGPALARPSTHIPPLIWQEVELIPNKFGPIASNEKSRLTSEFKRRNLVSEDARIALGAKGTVQFGERQIGPRGAVLAATNRK